MYVLTVFIQHCTKGLGKRNKAKKRNKRHIDKQKKKKSFLTHYKVFYVEISQEFTYN